MIKLFFVVAIVDILVALFFTIVLEVSSKTAFKTFYTQIIDLLVGFWCFDAEFKTQSK